MGRSFTTKAVLAIARLTDRDEIARQLAQLLTSPYALSFCGYSVWDWNRKLFVEHLGFPADAEPVHLRIEELDEYGSGVAIKADRPRLIRDIEKEGLREGEWQAHGRVGTRSYVTLPFHVRGRVAGAFGVASSIPEHFDNRDIERLRPVVQVLGLKLAELGVEAPSNLGPRISVLPSRVVVVGHDPALCRRLVRLLPQEVEVMLCLGDLESIPMDGPPPSLTVCCCKMLDKREAETIDRALRWHPRRLVVICREDDPGAVSWLIQRGRQRGLVTVERDGSASSDLSIRLAQWTFGEGTRPKWRALGLRRERSNRQLERALRLIEREPFRNWRVKDLAREAAMSEETLNRTIRGVRGTSAKPFLMDVRFQLLERFRRSGELSGARVYELFGFSSAEKMREWARLYRRQRETKD